MGVAVLVMSEPGTGKSRAIKGLDPETTFLIKPNKKQLPFEGAGALYGEAKKNVMTVTSFSQVGSLLTQINDGAKHIKTVVIEDLTHFFSARVMADAKTAGFDKWTQMAKDCFDHVIGKMVTLRDDLDLILIAHTSVERSLEGESEITIQTPGK
jgi:hypothetical protein